MAAASRPSVEVNSTGSGVVVGVRTVDLFESVGEGLPARSGLANYLQSNQSAALAQMQHLPFPERYP
ncbi:hypothetical protein [Nocardia abscessus]|uniref:hypothetical protein n=1 Tax=Nocardia abscessus TaxID=120957 RepID=UPI0024553B11|nr:hypothetical protein [Nocardia abscessus]